MALLLTYIAFRFAFQFAAYVYVYFKLFPMNTKNKIAFKYSDLRMGRSCMVGGAHSYLDDMLPSQYQSLEAPYEPNILLVQVASQLDEPFGSGCHVSENFRRDQP